MRHTVNELFKVTRGYKTHYLSRYLDGKKTSHFWFTLPGVPQGCTFSCINPWFGGPWNILWILFLIVIFILLQKNDFGYKKFQISCTGSKVPFWDFLKKPSRALKHYFCFRILWIPQTLGEVNWKWLVFLPSKSMDRQCQKYIIMRKRNP